jgi:crotonobetainyl-CoA:carnitine CoA-transferase CaiB-like acyl-CoA transferase
MEPFKDLDVLDLTQSIAGPVSTQLLATLGANIVKVEPPEGDAFRELIDGAMFASVNLGGKESICLDLKSEKGCEAAQRLAQKADVIVQSFRPGVVEKFDLDYETVSKDNESVVYCSVTGFGSDGPYSDRPAYDPVIQSMTGLMSMVGHPDEPPVRIGASLIDWGTGTMAAFLIASAIQNRELTGAGEHIDVNLYEVATAWMGYWYAYYTSTGDVPTRSGQGFEGIAPNEIFYAAGDEPFYLSAITDTFFERTCETINRPDLASDERFETNDRRWENRDELRKILNDEFSKFDREELCEKLADDGVPSGPLLNVDEVVEDDPHLKARGMLTDTYNQKLETSAKTASPPFSTTSGRPSLDTEPPGLGEHTRTVLAELGYDDEQIERMIEAGAVGVEQSGE